MKPESNGCKILTRMCYLEKSLIVNGIILRRNHYKCIPMDDGSLLLFDGTGWLKISQHLVFKYITKGEYISGN
jgi:hypothetical protein